MTFKQAFRPSGIIEEGNRYYSGKNKLYLYKLEDSVFTNGLDIGACDDYLRSVSELDISHSMKDCKLS